MITTDFISSFVCLVYFVVPASEFWFSDSRLFADSLTDFLHDLFSKQRHEFFFDVCVSRCQTFVSINISDDGFDAGWVSEGTQKFIGSEVGEPDAIHAFALVQHKLSGVESQHGISDPCGFTFDF